MLRAQNGQADKVMEALEGLNLTDSERELAGKYLKGEAGEEILAELTVRDMSGIGASIVKTLPVAKLMGSFTKKKQYGEAERLFNLLFALGSHTCFQCLGQENYMAWGYFFDLPSFPHYVTDR